MVWSDHALLRRDGDGFARNKFGRFVQRLWSPVLDKNSSDAGRPDDQPPGVFTQHEHTSQRH